MSNIAGNALSDWEHRAQIHGSLSRAQVLALIARVRALESQLADSRHPDINAVSGYEAGYEAGVRDAAERAAGYYGHHGAIIAAAIGALKGVGHGPK